LTNRLNSAKVADNQIEVALELQMADSIVNTAYSTHIVTITAQIGNATKVVEKLTIVGRDNTESPKLNATAEVINAVTFNNR